MTTEQKKVLLKYPDAKLQHGMNGECFVRVGELNLNDEFLMPATSDPSSAWEYAALSMRTKQHFDRTHPNRMGLSSDERKKSRYSRRRNKGRANGS
jgi:hypothetical protein